MKIKLLKVVCVSVLMLSSLQSALAAEFYRTGTITRLLTDDANYGACMIRIDVDINNGCPATGWVSLDCNDVHYSPGTGKRKFATALTALTLGSTVSVKIDNSKKFNDYCVASRLDIFSP